MGKNKLRKFAEVEAMPHVMQFPFGRLATEGFPLKGRWREDFFHNENPIVLELGCGRGEYTVGLARRFPDRNFIGVDIKGARIWAGAKESMQSGMTNVAFLRTNIEILPQFFSSGEVSEIWITFPDPQMKKVRKRLTSATFLDIYRRILCDDGIINLKTDSPFLYTYTSRLVHLNGLKTIAETDDLYHTPGILSDILGIRTHYESQWLERGLTIKYIAFELPSQPQLKEPETDDIPLDSYRSYGRNYNQTNQNAATTDSIPQSDN